MKAHFRLAGMGNIISALTLAPSKKMGRAQICMCYMRLMFYCKISKAFGASKYIQYCTLCTVHVTGTSTYIVFDVMFYTVHNV